MAYVRLKARLQPKLLWAELSQRACQISSRLVQSAEEAELLLLSEQLGRCERLARLDWTPEDAGDYDDKPEQIQVSRWLPALQAQAARGQVAGWAGDSHALDEYLAHAVRFYDVAKMRDDEIVRRALAKMRGDGKQLAVLITGGFHTDHLLTLLAQQSVEGVVITPVTGKDDPAQYAQVMKSKHRLFQQHRALADASGGAR